MTFNHHFAVLVSALSILEEIEALERFEDALVELKKAAKDLPVEKFHHTHAMLALLDGVYTAEQVEFLERAKGFLSCQK